MGCKVNTFDSHALENQFKSNGYELVGPAQMADITVVNTCSVTQNADREARYFARRLRRENPTGKIIFTGCYAQTDSALLAEMDEIDFVVPNEAKERLVQLVESGGFAANKLPTDVKAVSGNRQSHFKSSLTLFDHANSGQTRAFIKVQDGCNNFCAYCLIPYARGVSRSVGSEQVLEEIQRLAQAGTREFVLTGIHIGDYGRDLECFDGNPYPIVSLLEKFFEIPEIRLRISSLEPSELSEPLLDLLALHQDRVCDHFHLPLQSGSDPVLKRMGREYDQATYIDAVTRLRRRFPEASIGCDVIPGFPAETQEQFQETCDLVSTLELSYLHVFPYSKRPNTRAARMPDHIDGLTVKERAKTLRALSDTLKRNYAQKFIGRTLPVVWESELDGQGRRTGYTANYIPVVAPTGTAPATGTLTLARLKGLVDNARVLAKPC
jgi:threonylcarbamoyladenosine tRNA methylthiotransferase MtaB